MVWYAIVLVRCNNYSITICACHDRCSLLDSDEVMLLIMYAALDVVAITKMM